MQLFSNIKKFWSTIRWKMLIIFAFFSVISVALVACFSIALLNVVIRRESAYLIEERINILVDSSKRFTCTLVDQLGQSRSLVTNSKVPVEHSATLSLEARTEVDVLSRTSSNRISPQWLETQSFAGIVVDYGVLEIRSFQTLEREECVLTVVATIPLSESYLRELSKAAGLEVSNGKAVMLHPYRAQEGTLGEIEANFIPGSRRPVPIVIIARNWQTGGLEDWVVCQVRPSYSRTIDDLGHMGLRTASWVTPFGGITLALILVYGCGLALSTRLSRRIVAVIDALSHAALQVGKGNFSVRVTVPQRDQLGLLASSFNEMTRDLENLREQERQKVILEREIGLAHEVQQYLYPRSTGVFSTVKVTGATVPARVVSGDLYDFLPFGNNQLGLLCADISGKGLSAALVMAHLQALVHGRLLASDEGNVRPSPGAFVTALNGDLHRRFGNNRYATMIYGEFDGYSNVLRYVNCGHCPPILIPRGGQPVKLTEGDLPIGLFPDVAYTEIRVTLPSNSTLIIYTDGLTDALNSMGEEFGENRLMNYCASLPKGANAQTICELLSSKIADWSAGVDQSDDTTILVLTLE